MKNILLLFLLFLTASLIGQTRQDTVYSRWGVVANVKHFSKMDTENVSKAYLFQRGLTLGEEAWQIDSISVYNDKGEFVRTRSISELDPTDNTPVTRDKQPAQLIKEEMLKSIEAEMLNPSSKLIRVTGYAGQRYSRNFSFNMPNQE